MPEQFTPLKPGTLLAPVPAVMVSCARPGEKPNIVTLAWVGTVNSDPPMCSISVRKERFSHGIIRDTREFVINLVGEDQLRATDFCGVKSGRDVDKFAACNLTPVPIDGFAAPAIGECPVGSHDLFLGVVEKVGVNPGMMDAAGKLDFGKMKLIAYNHGAYYALGPALGFFGYSVAAPDVLERRMKELR